MFNFKDIQNLVFMAIEQNGYWFTRVNLSDDVFIYLSCTIDKGVVRYFLMTNNKGTYVEYPNCSLEFILNFDFSLNVPSYSDLDFLNLYASYYSLNKTQLADNLGISRPTLNKYFSGSVPLPLIYKKFIALDFNLPSHLLDFDFLHSDNYCPLTKQQVDTLPF